MSACGGDDPERASTPAVTAPAPASTSTTPATPTATTPSTTPEKASKADKDAEPEDGPAVNATAADDPAAISDETAQSVKKASAKRQTPDQIAADMKKVHSALKAAGIDPGDPVASDTGSDAAALAVDGGSTTIIFFPSPRMAADNAAKFEKVFEGSPQFVRVDRKANRLFLFNSPTKPDEQQLKRYRQIRQIANGAI